MGQYWRTFNLDKKEFIKPHDLAFGAKLWEQLAAYPGTGAALVILCAAMPVTRGGGDLDLEENWNGKERTLPEHNTKPGPMPEGYSAVAARTIGRWAGDRIALVGDYAEHGDLAPEHQAGEIYGNDKYRDITPDVAAVIEHELQGRFSGEGWKKWEPEEEAAVAQ